MPRPQFSLKTLLWLMTVVAALFAGREIGIRQQRRNRLDELVVEQERLRDQWQENFRLMQQATQISRQLSQEDFERSKRQLKEDVERKKRHLKEDVERKKRHLKEDVERKNGVAGSVSRRHRRLLGLAALSAAVCAVRLPPVLGDSLRLTMPRFGFTWRP